MATKISIVSKAMAIAIAEAADCATAQQCARRMALTIGFAGQSSEEIALVAMELGTNLFKHAGRGTLTISSLEREGVTGIELEATDDGPGIADVERAFEDGYSTSGSLGYGLGTANRLMDEMEVSSSAGRGTAIVCRKWLRAERSEDSRSCHWDVGVFTRAKGNARENGDAFAVKEWHGQLLVGLIDGLGHGEEAQRAALAAQQYVQKHYDQPMEAIFAGTARACRGTRGVVMALGRFWSPARLEWCSVGNIEVRAWSGTEKVAFGLKRGILGVENLRVQPQNLAWKPEWLLALHTDGLRTHWQWSDFPGIEKDSSQIAASRLMRELQSERDDATVVVVRGTKP